MIGWDSDVPGAALRSVSWGNLRLGRNTIPLLPGLRPEDPDAKICFQ